MTRRITALLLALPLLVQFGCETTGGRDRSPLLAATVAPQPPDQERLDAARKRLELFMATHYAKGLFPSFAAGVFGRKGVLYTHYINSSESKKYSTGSVTKLLTATLFQIYVDRRQVHPYETVDRHFPELAVLRWKNQPVMLQHLVTHTGGFPDLRFYKTPDYRQIASLDLKVPMPIYPPGRHYRYSNHGYIMLGHVLEKACGDVLAVCMKKTVFDPVGMNDSEGPTTGAGGFVTTLHDLMLFGQMYLNRGTAAGHRILRSESIEDMLIPGFFIPPSEHNYYTGRGWRVKTDRRGVVTMFHIGGANYTSAWLQLFPPYDVGIAYLGNPPNYNDALMNYLSGVQYLLGEIAGAEVNSDRAPYAWKADPAAMALRSQYEGSYTSPAKNETLRVEIERRGDAEHLMVKGMGSYELFPETHHIFNGGREFLTHQFVVDPTTGKVVAMANAYGYYEKQEPTPVSAVAK